MKQLDHKKILGEILNKEMSRKEFIGHLAMGVVALTGIGTVLKALGGSDTPSKQKIVSQSSGYGSGYGGSAYGQ